MGDPGLLNGRYRIEQKLGEGGMGEVFKVTDTVFGDRLLAYKRLKAEGGNLDFFKHEFKVLARLDHPSLVKVHDFGITEGGCYYTCEFLEGDDLYKATEGIDWEGLYEITRQVLEALGYIHDRGLVHYDVKPENVNVQKVAPERPGQRPGYTVKLVDFGLTGEATHRGGKIKGTVHYLAPEVAREQPADRRADLYSLGISLYFCVTRKLPYEGGSAFSVICKHLDKVPEPPALVRHDVPEAWSRFILKLLEKDPADRYPSAWSALSDLNRRLGKHHVPALAQQHPSGLGSPQESVSQDRLVSTDGASPRDRSQGRLSSRFVGRAAEVDLLASALPDPLSRVRDTLRYILMTGEPGVGKTRLIDELKVVSQLRGIPFLRARCREGDAAPLTGLVREILLLEKTVVRRLDRKPSRAGSARHDAVESRIAALAREHQDDLEAVFPGIMGLPIASATPGPARSIFDSQRFAALPREPRDPDRRLVHERVAQFLLAATAERPCALVVEDAHLATDATLELLAAVVRASLAPEPGKSERARAASMLLVVTARLAEGEATPAPPAPQRHDPAPPRRDPAKRASSVRRKLEPAAPPRSAGGELRPPLDALVRLAKGEALASTDRVLARELVLPRLDDKETSALATSILALREPDEALGKKLHAATGGNPFFIEELVQSLLEEGVLVMRRGLARPMDLGRVEPPRSLSELIGKRLASLGPDARAVLHALGVLGRASPLGLLAATADLDPERALDALDTLGTKQLTVRTVPEGESTSEAEGPHFAIGHAQVQRAVQRDADAATQVACHERAGLALEAGLLMAIDPAKGVLPPLAPPRSSIEARRAAALERLARHFSLAGDAPRAFAYSLAAGEHASRVHRSEEAVEHLDRALSLLRRAGVPDTDSLEVRVLQLLADSLSTVGRYADAARVLEALVASADALVAALDRSGGGDARAQGRKELASFVATGARRRLGAVGLKRGDYVTATRWLSEALARAPDRGPMKGERAKALQTMARIGLWRGDYLQAIAFATEALDLWQGLKAHKERLPALNVLSTAEYYRGRYTRAAALLREGLVLSRQHVTDFRSLIFELGLEGEAEKVYEQALSVLARPNALRRGAGDTYGIVLSFSELGTYLHLRGEAVANIRYQETSLAVYERRGNAQGIALSLNNLAVYKRYQGDMAPALATLERALAIEEGTNDRHGAAVALQNLAMLKLALGDHEGAEAQAAHALALGRDLGIAWMAGQGHRTLGRALAQKGDLAGAERELQRAEGVFLRLGNPRSLGDALLDRAELAADRGRFEQALALVERGRRTGDEDKAEDFLARARLLAGRACLADDPGHAIDELEAGLVYADALGLAELRLSAHRELLDAHLRHGTLRLALRHAERARELEEHMTRTLPPDLREKVFRFAPSVRARESSKRLQERLLAESF